MRYLVASDLGPKFLREIRASDVNDYVGWRLKVGQVTFTARKDGRQRAVRGSTVSAPTINKSLRVLSSALRFAHREGLIDAVPHIEMLPETDAKRVHGPSVEEYQRVLVLPS